MEAQPEIRAADDARVVFGLEPSRAQLHAPRRQPGEPALELDAPGAVAGHEDDEMRKAAGARARLPSANALLEKPDGFDHDVEVFVLGPARWDR